jgi:hypothetical protein
MKFVENTHLEIPTWGISEGFLDARVFVLDTKATLPRWGR